MDGWIVDSSGVLQAIGASQASCDPGDANFQMLEALGDSAESEQFFNINLAADPDVIDVCGVSPQPAELARVLEVNAGLAGQLPDPGIIPAVPTEAVLPEIPPGIASPDGVIPGVEPGGAPVDYDGYVLPALGVVCGISFLAIWGVGAGIGLLRSQDGGGYEEQPAIKSNHEGNKESIPESGRVRGLSARQIGNMDKARLEILTNNAFGLSDPEEAVEAFHQKGYGFVNEANLKELMAARVEAYERVIGTPMKEARVSTSEAAAQKLGGPENLQALIRAEMIKIFREEN